MPEVTKLCNREKGARRDDTGNMSSSIGSDTSGVLGYWIAKAVLPQRDEPDEPGNAFVRLFLVRAQYNFELEPAAVANQ